MNGKISKIKNGVSKGVTSGKKMNIPVHDCFFANDDGVAFEMTESISQSAMEKDSSEPHRHPFYEILYVEKANGRHTIDHNSYENIEDKVFLICPGQVHCWEDVSNINGMLIYFNEDFLVDSTLSVNAIWELNLLREMGGYGVSLSEKERIQMDELIRLMYREYMHKGHEYASVIRSYLNIFLIHLFRVYQREATGFWPQQRTSTLLENFQKLVRSHVTERRTVTFYADRLGVSMGYLNEQVKTQLGVTPSSVIKRAAVDEAKRLIANTNLSMTEIALSMGFADGSYFCRLFKNEMGITPLAFKKSCLRNSMRA
ncbi:transcriptional regulator [Clostridia bacterium]|nr:transcriptional regulator [Clostridia bacterium]